MNPARAVLLKGEEAFARDLPRLLQECEGKWVAYWGEERLGVADNSLALYRQYAGQINPKELFVELVHPEAARREFSFASPDGPPQ
jgi:hypothetical protein